jgi:polysaccharide biosynthesis/export protein
LGLFIPKANLKQRLTTLIGIAFALTSKTLKLLKLGKYIQFLALITLGAILISSCRISPPLYKVHKGKVNYDPRQAPSVWMLPAPVVKNGDKLSITVWEHPELSIGDVTGVAVSNESSGKWLIVDNLGEIKLPKAGKVKVSGYNILEVTSILEQRFSDQLKDPIVLVRALNHRVTVLGEVLHSGVYDLDNDVVTVDQIVAMAGGFTDYANTETVEVIRKDTFETHKLNVDLTNLNNYSIKNILLQPDDVVYVPPIPLKSTQKKLEKSAPVISIFTSLTIILSVLLKN